MIQFGSPGFFALLLIIAAMVAAGVWFEHWRRQARASFGGPQSARWPRSVAWAGTLLLLAAAALLVLAAARPQWGSRELNREREGVDLVIALDISQSMHSNDVAPSRLLRAQDELARLVESLRGSRIGLVFFAGSAIIRSPLTSDTQAMVQLIRRSDSEAGLTRTGSDIGVALDQALIILQDSETTGKAVLVVSDGEDHVNAYALRLPALRDLGAVVYSAGVGTAAGGTIPETNLRTGQPQLKLGAGGQPVVTRLNEATLQAIAGSGGGRYLSLGAGDQLASLRDDLAALQQTPLGEQVQRLPIERFQLFAGAAFVLLVLSWFVPEHLRVPAVAQRRLRLRGAPGVAVAIFALLIGACGSDSLSDQNAAANQLYDDGDYEAALAAYEELLADRPDVPELAFNAGNTLNRLGNYERAVAETQRALPPKTIGLGSATYFALGNHLFALDLPREAFDAYRSALLLDPSDGDAKYNLELTLLRLQAQEQEQTGDGPGQPQQPSGQQGEPQQPAPGQPSASPSPGVQPSGTPQPTPAEVQRSLQEALRGIDEQLTFEQALQILNLLRQQQERQQPSSQPGGSGGPDY